jgi:dTDP-4-amino-4,6-dideoxygalactose transaminase
MYVPLIDLKAQYRAIRDEIREAVDAVLSSQKFILGDRVKELEEETARYCGTSHAIGCGSGTDALLLSLLAVGVNEGDEVITTAYSFFATAGMIAWIGAKPVFVDINPDTFNMRMDEVKAKITNRTRAIIAVHLFGQCSRTEDLDGIGIPVIEDAAQSIGASRYGRKAGSLGFTGCFSFFPTKNLGGCGDGGMITTGSTDTALKLRQLRAHGQTSQYHHVSIGTNSRLDELQAAILSVKFSYLDQWNRKRAEHAEYYQENLQKLPLQLPQVDAGNHSIHHQYVILAEDRDRLKSYLTDQGIGTAVYYPLPLPHQPCFSQLGFKVGQFPGAELCAAKSLALPVYPEMTQQQQEYVVSAITTFYR